jgi:ABC-type polysaccharide/polyol phosphate transport system ATPase subunit
VSAPTEAADLSPPSGSAPAIRVRHLSKVYRLYDRPWHLGWELVTGRSKHREFAALKDISFDVARGQVVGVVGRNGAGKSTLLKILAGTLDRTAGDVEVNGKISAILELGTGFHPDRTGRENILMGGLCLGMSRAEIAERTDEIIDFSELRHVIDRPFKTYSSGMQARLTFSTAVSVRPDIFIVDEALATGDLLFQEKCLRKMRSICESGATVLLVTHSLYHVYEMCDACLLIGEGRILDSGEPRKVGEAYERVLWRDRQEQLARERPDNHVPAGAAEVVGVEVTTPDGRPTAVLLIDRPYRVVVRVRFHDDVPRASVGFRVQTVSGTGVIGDTSVAHGIDISGRRGTEIVVRYEFTCRLAGGSYLLGGGVSEVLSGGHLRNLHFVRGMIAFSVEGRLLNALVDPACKVTVETLAGGESDPLAAA